MVSLVCLIDCLFILFFFFSQRREFSILLLRRYLGNKCICHLLPKVCIMMWEAFCFPLENKQTNLKEILPNKINFHSLFYKPLKVIPKTEKAFRVQNRVLSRKVVSGKNAKFGRGNLYFTEI